MVDQGDGEFKQDLPKVGQDTKMAFSATDATTTGMRWQKA
jgi:hypothetical protein